MKNTKVKTMVEGAVMIALATVLSYIRIIHLPVGGSVTLLSMLPIIVFSIRHGVKQGMWVSFAFSLIQLMQGAIVDGLFGWGLSPVMLVSCILLDYLVAFTVLGFGGLFRGKGAAGWVLGVVLAGMLRFACHFLSGVVVWKTVGELWSGFTANNVFLYSFLYNGFYMLPEILFTAIGAFALFQVPQTRKLLAEA